MLQPLSPHFNLSEFIKSDTAQKKGIIITPNPRVVANLRSLCRDVLEPIRSLVGEPILITSGYRPSILNKIVGGSTKSHHLCFDGFSACDFELQRMPLDKAFEMIVQSSIPYHQLILYERHIHVSYYRLKRQALIKGKDGVIKHYQIDSTVAVV